MTGTIQALVDKFTGSARLHFQATSEGDHKVANREAKRIHRTFRKLLELGPESREALLQVALSSNDAAAVMAAVYSLKYDTNRSIAVLQRFSKDPGILGFQAEQALKRWKSGEWQLE